MTAPENKLRVLLVPDSIYWITGTIAKNIARFNPWIEATVVSGPVADQIFEKHPALINNFDLVHFTCPYSSKAWLPRLHDSIPVVTSHHHVTDWGLLKHNLDGDAIVVGSPEWADDLRERGADMSRVFCVPYGVDATLFHPVPAEKRNDLRNRVGFKRDDVVVGFFGKNSSNDDDRKGIDVFTAAIKELKSKLPGTAVLIIGPGWHELRNSLSANGIKVVSIPFVPDLNRLAEMYRTLDFYWVTARVEGGPVTLLEAMSTEVCCLTTPVGIAREIIRSDGNAVSIKFNDPHGFANETVALVNDQNRRRHLGTQARKTILESMHVEITTRAIRRVYERAFEYFDQRHNQQPRTHNWIVSQTSDNTNNLAGLPAAMHKQVQMLESLAWSEHLVLYHRQRALAAKFILNAWRQQPASLQPLRVLLRRFLPVSLVARIVSVKNRSAAGSPLIPDYQQAKK